MADLQSVLDHLAMLGNRTMDDEGVITLDARAWQEQVINRVAVLLPRPPLDREEHIERGARAILLGRENTAVLTDAMHSRARELGWDGVDRG